MIGPDDHVVWRVAFHAICRLDYDTIYRWRQVLKCLCIWLGYIRPQLSNLDGLDGLDSYAVVRIVVRCSHDGHDSLGYSSEIYMLISQSLI